MTDTGETTTVDEHELADGDGHPNWQVVRRRLREAQKRTDELEAELSARQAADYERAEREAEREATVGALRAELTFTKAGVDTDDTIGRSFAATYSGDMSPDAIALAYAEHLEAARRAQARFYASLPTNGDDHAQP